MLVGPYPRMTCHLLGWSLAGLVSGLTLCVMEDPSLPYHPSKDILSSTCISRCLRSFLAAQVPGRDAGFGHILQISLNQSTV